MKIFKHLKSDWFRYGFETLAVIVGILVAFALDNWNENRRFQQQLINYTERLLNDLTTDTLNIQALINDSRYMQERIEDYFEYFDSGDIPLQDLIDSAFNVKPSFFRYFPINYTLIDLQSSGKIELLNEDLRKSLIQLTNEQDYLKIIIEKTIIDIKEQQNEIRRYFDTDMSDSNFFEKVSWDREEDIKKQGLLHKHSELTHYHRLAYYMDSRGNAIIEQTLECIKLLDNNHKNKLF